MSSMSGATPPDTSTLPSSGSSTPAMALSRVLLPPPLEPTRPTASPGPTENEMSLRAQKVSLDEVFSRRSTISRSESLRRRER